MLLEEYIDNDITPEVGGVVYSDHHFIITRGYPLLHKILSVKKQKDGWWVEVESKTPLGVKSRQECLLQDLN